jgi:hypothetical protein
MQSATYGLARLQKNLQIKSVPVRVMRNRLRVQAFRAISSPKGADKGQFDVMQKSGRHGRGQGSGGAELIVEMPTWR